jgi:hypothetical protein
VPITTPQAMATLIPNLVSCAMLGVGVPKLARGLGIGLSTWTPTISISTTDAGSAGVGKGVPVPIIIVQPVLYANLLLGMRDQKLLGVLAPAFIMGLTNGLVALYAQGFTNTAHVGVGTGAGVATFRPPPAFSHIRAGFAAVGMSSDTNAKFARALSQGLEKTFRALVLPQPIVGSASPVAAAGRGFGTIL